MLVARLSLIVGISFTITFAAQPTFSQGVQPFSTQAAGPFSTVDLASSNVVLSIPIRSKLGAIPFQFALMANSSALRGIRGTYRVLEGDLLSAGQLLGGVVNSGPPTTVPCPTATQRDFEYNTWVFYDATGAPHSFPGIDVTVGQYTSCDTLGTFVAQADDPSGYTLAVTVTGSGGRGYTTQVWDKSGNTVAGHGLTDPDGNSISGSTTVSGNCAITTTTDTLGQVALTATTCSNGNFGPDTYVYTDKNGGNQTYTVAYTSMHWKTNFLCGGNPTDVDLPGTLFPTTITETPSGQQYTLTYESTPGYPGDITGRIQQITFPSGGYIKYSYGGGTAGLDCTSQVVPQLTKTVYDANGNTNTWTYLNNDSGSFLFTVTETDPAGNQTVYTFENEFQVEKQVYQGPVSPNNLLSTIVTCYAGNFANCTTNGAAGFSQTDVFTYPGNSTSASLVETKFNSAGTVAEIKKYDFGAATTLPPTAAPTASPISDTRFTYDGQGASCGSLAIPYMYDRPCSITTVNSSGATVSQTKYTYNSAGHPTQTSTLVSGSTYLTSSASYNPNGTVASFTDVNGGVTNYFYNGTGGCNNLLPTSTSFPVNSLSTSQTWDCNGGVRTSITDENGQVTNYGYLNQSGTADPFWRVLSTQDPLGNTTSNTYSSPTTQETSLLFNNGASAADTLTTFDGIGRQIFVQQRQSPGSSNFDSVQYSYGWTSNKGPFSTVSVPYAGTQGQAAPSGTAVTTTQNDPLGRPLTVTDGGNGTTSYTYSQNDLLVTSGPAPAGENTKRRQLEYDGLGRLTSVCEITAGTASWPGGICTQHSSQTGYWTKYTYDALGDLLTVTQNAQAGSNQQTRTYTFDGMQRLTSEQNPETAQAAVTYTYDTDATCGTYSGDPVKRVDPLGNVTCFASDPMHRKLSATYPSGPYAPVTPSKYFVYDTATVNGVAMTNAKGRLAEAYTGPSNGKITDLGFSYTARGEASDIYESTVHSGGYNHVNQTYWEHGLPKQVSQLSGLTAITYGAPDGEGRPTQVSASSGQNPVTGITYNAASLPSQVTFGSGDTDIFAYDSNTLRMTQFKFNVGTQPQYLSAVLTWNANGTLGQLAITDQFNSADTQTCNYAHDDLVRIVSANCASAANQTFSYDPFGNISKSGSPNTFQPTYSAATNRFTSIPGCSSLSYDSNGNVLNDCNHTYAWDADGNSITMDTVGLTFDALDRIVEQNRSGSYTQIVYAPTGDKLAMMNAQSLTKAFIPLPGQATAVYTSSGIDHYRHSDWLGSARLTSSPAQNYVSSVAYAPFGESYAQSGTADLSFTGMNPDTVSGDYDFLYREYSTQGRWPQPDPAGLAAVDPINPQSWNRYAYVLNNPLRATDPLGLDCVFLNDPGDAVEEIDGELGSGDCGDLGGVFFQGTIDQNSIRFDPNSDWVFANGTAGDAQFSCTDGGSCDLSSLDAFNAAIGHASVTMVSGNTSWWHAYTSTASFLTFSGGPGNVPTCAGQALTSMANDLVGGGPPESASPTPSTIAATGLKAASIQQSARAAAYAASRPNSLGGTGLICPNCSSVYRSMMSKAEVLGEASEAAGLVDVSVAAWNARVEVQEQARNGTCSAAFPIF